MVESEQQARVNPVVVAATLHQFDSDTDFLEHLARKEDIHPQTTTAYIRAYRRTVEKGEPLFIPYFAIPEIARTLDKPVDQLQEQAAEPTPKSKRDKKKKRPRRQIGRRRPSRRIWAN